MFFGIFGGDGYGVRMNLIDTVWPCVYKRGGWRFAIVLGGIDLISRRCGFYQHQIFGFGF
jgi:hypothetical protein